MNTALNYLGWLIIAGLIALIVTQIRPRKLVIDPVPTAPPSAAVSVAIAAAEIHSRSGATADEMAAALKMVACAPIQYIDEYHYDRSCWPVTIEDTE